MFELLICSERRRERREKIHTKAERCKGVFLYIFPDVGEGNPWSDSNFGQYFRVTDARKLENLMPSLSKRSAKCNAGYYLRCLDRTMTTLSTAS
jgi:hypothetical protein